MTTLQPTGPAPDLHPLPPAGQPPAVALPQASSRLNARWRSLRLRHVLVYTTPVVGLLLYLVGASVNDYLRYRQFDDFWSVTAEVDQFFVARARGLLNGIRSLPLDHQLNPEAPDAGIVRLAVRPAVWDSIHGDPMQNWGKWFTGALARENSLLKVEMRKRGDNSVHWLTAKHSFTIKTEQRALFKNHQTLGLSVKDVLSAFIANRMASEVGILAPSTYVAPVFLNQRFYGVFRLNETVDENFLRANLRLPGNLFRGDAAERGDAYRNQNRNLFENAYIWERAAKSQRSNASATASLVALLTGSNATSLEEHLHLMSLMDRQKVARMIAYLLVMGDPYHMDGVHNQFWYEDPWSMILEPIPWDVRLLDLGRPPRPVNPFLKEFLRDPFAVDEVMQNVRSLVEEDHILERSEKLTRDVYDRYRPYFEYDRLRAGLIPDVGSPEAVVPLLEGNVRLLKEWMGDARMGFHAEPAPGGALVLDFEARGRVGAELLSLELVGVHQGGARLYADRNLNGVLDSGDSLLPTTGQPSPSGGRLTLRIPEALYAGWDTHQFGLHPGRQQYRFFLLTSGATSIRPELRNRVTGHPVEPEAWAAGTVVAPATGWNPWRFPIRKAVVHRLSGRVRLSENLEIPPGDTLLIAPGTTIRMDPDVSLLVRGRMVARGTARDSITFEQAVPGRPWGTVALQGHGADSSHVEYARFLGGGGIILHEVEYTGSVSLHYVSHVLFDHVEVARNVRSDDAFHAYHATFAMRHCLFHDTNADAMDLDYANGEISNCRIIHAGNDGFDLMTSNPRIFNNYIEGDDDKGVSVGEGSNPFIFNNYITKCLRGIEVKDGSEPVILNNYLVGNIVGIRQRQKNVRYAHGGWGKVINTVVENNRQDFVSDDNSRLTVLGLKPGQRPDSAISASTAKPEELAWLYRHYGVQPTGGGLGLLPGWASVEPIPVLDSASFEDDFGEYADGWVGSGGVERVIKRNRNLVISIGQGLGVATRRVDWDLTGDQGRHTVVFEIAARDLESAAITLVSDSGRITRPLQPAEDLSQYRFEAIDLPPAHYREIQITGTTKPGFSHVERNTGLVDFRNSRIDLHSYRLFRVPGEAVVAGGVEAPPRAASTP